MASGIVSVAEDELEISLLDELAFGSVTTIFPDFLKVESFAVAVTLKLNEPASVGVPLMEIFRFSLSISVKIPFGKPSAITVSAPVHV